MIESIESKMKIKSRPLTTPIELLPGTEVEITLDPPPVGRELVRGVYRLEIDPPELMQHVELAPEGKKKASLDDDVLTLEGARDIPLKITVPRDFVPEYQAMFRVRLLPMIGPETTARLVFESPNEMSGRYTLELDSENQTLRRHLKGLVAYARVVEPDDLSISGRVLDLTDAQAKRVVLEIDLPEEVTSIRDAVPINGKLVSENQEQEISNVEATSELPIAPLPSSIRGLVAGDRPLPPLMPSDTVATEYTRNIVLHHIIKEGTERLSFTNYQRYMDFLLCGVEIGDLPPEERKAVNDLGLTRRRFLPFTDTDAYRILKTATEAFLLLRSASLIDLTTDNDEIRSVAERIGAIRGVEKDPITGFNKNYLVDRNIEVLVKGEGKEVGILPYLALVFDRLGETHRKQTVFPGFGYSEDERQDIFTDSGLDSCRGVLAEKLGKPLFVELIWSYWHEQAMQVQTMFAIRNRFQNVSAGTTADPLAAMEIGVLRPLNNLLWGYIQDEQHRLTLVRRNYEYEHHYGLSLRGRAIPAMPPADRRSKFIEAFHNLLYLATVFFKEDDDTTRRADPFPVLHALKEVHFLLSEGAHNQFGDLPTTARIEMLMEQWLLSRPEFREFLPSRESVAYPETWMAPVDAMKALQGWNSTSAIFFNDLARFGEMLLLSIRYDAWSSTFDRNAAANWAKIWRSEIQGYIHAYRIVTGVDLSIEPAGVAAEDRRKDPGLLIQQRWEEQKQAGLAKPNISWVAPTPTAGAWARPRLVTKK